MTRRVSFAARLVPLLFTVFIATFMMTAALLVPIGSFAAADSPEPSTDRADRPITASDLEAFFDGIMATHFQTYHIPGAVVAVVKDGQILLAKGYGYADLATHRPVDASRTLFRIGSVSKLFTWTAVMQLVEHGKVDLNRDINDYLSENGAPFRVPATYPEPITMAHLMNHTAGFEDRGVGLFSHDPASIRPLGEVLTDTLPQRVRTPGDITAYSNHGTALAGYIVELVSGTPWIVYIEENILKPLGMGQTSARQPLPSQLQGQLAVGYEYDAASAHFEPQPFEYIPAAPAGAFSATAMDMARFMIAHLELGRLADSQLLQTETARTMQSVSFRLDSRLGGIAHGFLEQPYGRLRTIGHGGDTFAFHSELRLVPSHNLGIFVSYNSPDGAVARDQLLRAFFDRYFASYYDLPGSQNAVVAALAAPDSGAQAQDAQNLSQYGGVYGSTRVPRTTMDRLLELLTVATVRPDPADETGSSLLVTLSPSRGVQRFQQVEPGLFQEVGGPGRISFTPGSDGGPMRLLMGSAWMAEKMKWYQTPGFQGGVAVACFLIFLSAVVGWPIAAIRQRRRGRTVYPDKGGSKAGSATAARAPRLLTLFAGTLSTLYVVVLILMLVALQDAMAIGFGVPAALRFGLIIALVTAILSPLTALAAVAVWRRRYFTLAGRVHFTLVAVANVVFAAWLNHWNLLGFRF